MRTRSERRASAVKALINQHRLQNLPLLVNKQQQPQPRRLQQRRPQRLQQRRPLRRLLVLNQQHQHQPQRLQQRRPLRRLSHFPSIPSQIVCLRAENMQNVSLTQSFLKTVLRAVLTSGTLPLRLDSKDGIDLLRETPSQRLTSLHVATSLGFYDTRSERFEHLRSLSVCNVVRDRGADVRVLLKAASHTLTKLTLRNCDMKDEALKSLRECKSLTSLDLRNNSSINGVCLLAVKDLPLRKLVLRQMSWPDASSHLGFVGWKAALEGLAGSLTHLDLGRSQGVTKSKTAEIWPLFIEAKQLRVLRLERTDCADEEQRIMSAILGGGVYRRPYDHELDRARAGAPAWLSRLLKRGQRPQALTS